jgi:hypothetical protein
MTLSKIRDKWMGGDVSPAGGNSKIPEPKRFFFFSPLAYGKINLSCFRSERVNMGRILDAMESFFKKDDWPYTKLEDRPIHRTGFNGKNGQWTCFSQERTDQEQLVFYSVLPIKVPEDKRFTIAEFITRANYGMVIGNFELDFSDGEIRYKTSIDVEGEELTEGMIHHLVYANVYTMDRYFPGFMKILYSGTLPEDAIKEVEG